MRVHEVTKKRNKWFSVIGVAVAVLGIVKGLLDASSGNMQGAISAVIGLFILLIVFYSTIREISEEGVDEISSVYRIKKHNFWKWEDIEYLTADFRKQPPYVIITVKKNKGRRQVRILENEVERVLYWAAKRNPDIVILHNNDCVYESKYAQIMTISEYRRTHQEEYRPSTFHEFANEMRKIKRERLLCKPELKKTKVKRNKKKIRNWRL